MYNEELSKLISEARELFGRLKSQAEINEKQILMYQELLDKRIMYMEKTIAVFRNLAITFLIAVVVPFVIGGFTIKHTVDNLVESDYATKQEVIRSFGVIIDRQTDAIEAFSPEEADKFNQKTKEDVLDVFGYKSRGIKQE